MSRMDDVINRQNAVEAIKSLPITLDAETVQRCIEAISNMPSAQPQHDISKANFLCPICGAEMEVAVSEWEGES